MAEARLQPGEAVVSDTDLRGGRWDSVRRSADDRLRLVGRARGRRAGITKVVNKGKNIVIGPTTGRFSAQITAKVPGRHHHRLHHPQNRHHHQYRQAEHHQLRADKEPTEWLPPYTGYWCTYVTNWVADHQRFHSDRP
ncbi:hypothetical protein [Streptomyces sp. NPDC001975]